MARALLLLTLAVACGESETGPPAGPDAPAPAPRLDLAASHARMLAALDEIRRRTADDNPWLGDALARELRPRVAALPEGGLTRQQWWDVFRLGVEELRLGREAEAVRLLTRVVDELPRVKPPPAPRWRDVVTYRLGVAYLRLAETENCCRVSRPGSCVLPITAEGLHDRPAGARGAIQRFEAVLAHAAPGSDLHLGSRWLLNLAHMLVGTHPDGVAEAHRIPAAAYAPPAEFPRFENIARKAGLDTFSLSGGAVADDFDNDGDLDLLVSTWETSGRLRYWRNEGDGSFADRTGEAGLRGILGGLNLVQADYDNDGHVDVYVLRGAWVGNAGRYPNSLLRNRGGGRFVDATFAAGLGETHHPTQTASWADYDGDGDLDLYVGNETFESEAPCQLFENRGDGTFTDVAARAGVTNDRFTKAVIWGDYDGDRRPDLFVSNLDGFNRLYKNNGDGTFTDVAPQLGLRGPARSFPAWFFDYDNDGVLDLFVSAYAADLWDLAASALGQPVKAELARLLRGDGKGGFTDVTADVGLTRPNAPMGSNFGDLDNDGWLDFHLGTGYPSYDAVMPNVMFRNDKGRRFVDVSAAGGFAHLQKGHAVVFADLDHDGDQDVFQQMGGAYPGDRFYDALYENPGFGNHWLAVRLVGTKSNRSAIGARIRVVIREDGRERSVYKHVNSGATFGANPLRQTIGLGKADAIVRLEVFWPTTGETQAFSGVPRDAFVRITEGEARLETVPLRERKLGAAK